MRTSSTTASLSALEISPALAAPCAPQRRALSWPDKAPFRVRASQPPPPEALVERMRSTLLPVLVLLAAGFGELCDGRKARARKVQRAAPSGAAGAGAAGAARSDDSNADAARG